MIEKVKEDPVVFLAIVVTLVLLSVAASIRVRRDTNRKNLAKQGRIGSVGEPQTIEGSDEFFMQVAKEITAGKRDEELWAKAHTLEHGDEKNTEALYILLRVARLGESRNTNNTKKNRSYTPSPGPKDSFKVSLIVIISCAMAIAAGYFITSTTNLEEGASATLADQDSSGVSPSDAISAKKPLTTESNAVMLENHQKPATAH